VAFIEPAAELLSFVGPAETVEHVGMGRHCGPEVPSEGLWKCFDEPPIDRDGLRCRIESDVQR
jgi:hypothetical protein